MYGVDVIRIGVMQRMNVYVVFFFVVVIRPALYAVASCSEDFLLPLHEEPDLIIYIS